MLKLVLLSLLLLVINPSPPPAARRVFIDSRHALGLLQSAQRTQQIILEEAYCLVGVARPNGDYYILAVVRPEQKAAIRRWGTMIMSSVISRACPIGSIGDMHTHPFGSQVPSPIDTTGWVANRRYTLHLIAFVVEAPDRIGFVAHDYSDPEQPYLLTGDWLVITREEGT